MPNVFRVLVVLVALATSPLHAQQPARLVFGTNWLAEAEHGGFYQAVAEGLYRRHGLDVTIRMGGPQVNPLQLLLCKMPIGDIEYESDNAGRFAVRIEEHAAFGLEPPDGAAGVQNPVFGIKIARLLRSLDRGSYAGPVFRVNKRLP